MKDGIFFEKNIKKQQREKGLGMKKFLFGILGLLFAVPAVAATLPAGYTELEYIESSGTQYIDTGIANNSLTNPTVEITLRMMQEADTTWFGAPTTDAKGIFYNVKTSSPEAWYVRWGSQKFGDRPLTYQPGKSVLDLVFTDALHTVKLTGTTNLSVYVDDELVGTNTYNSCAFTATGNIHLFGVETTSTKRIMQLGMWKISNNDTLLQHLIPAKRLSDNEIGMYDTVSGQFFTNAGTGEFIAGPAVLNSCRNLFDTNTFYGHNLLTDTGGVGSVNAAWSLYRYIGVKPNTTYTLSYICGGNNQYRRLCGYDSSDTFTSLILKLSRAQGGEAGDSKSFTFTTDSTTTKLAYSLDNRDTEVMLVEGTTATEYVPFCANQIKIATTAYNSARFSPVVTELNDTIATIRSVVTNTINQTKAIADLQATKQTRPNETCPAGKKCLLVEDDAGQPHWYEIIENAD